MSANPRSRRILRNLAVREKSGFPSNSSLYDAIKRHGFPRPIPLGARAVGWVEEEVDRWLEERIAERNAGANWQHMGPPRRARRSEN